MILKTFLVAIIFLLSIIPIKAKPQSTKFLSKKQIKNFYKLLTSEIEYFDAEGIETRHRTKKVSWKKIKNHYRKQFHASKNWNELNKAFKSFGDSFVNLHSSFRFYTPNKKAPTGFKSNKKIGYEYPNIGFFDIDSKKSITHINQIPIKKAFDYFLNYECPFNTIVGCQYSFVRRFSSGRLLVKNRKPQTMRLANKDSVKITYQEITPPKRDTWKTFEPTYFEKNYPDWKLIKKGYRVALLKKGDVALIKIASFIYKKGSGRDFRCTKSGGKQSMCEDIIFLRNGLNSIKNDVKHLILDVQSNRGGNENSAFVAEFAQKPFYDLRVQYKKTPILKDKELRKYLFYFSGRAESWYQNLVKTNKINKIKNGDFLPSRGDFCRGARDCSLTPITPNNHYKLKNIIVPNQPNVR